MDIVELVMDVEDVFGIEVPDDDYAELRTVGELHQYILRQLHVQRELQLAHPDCPSIPAFLATRQALQSLLAVERNQIRPRTDLQRIVPRYDRKAVWERLQSLTDIRLPALVLPDGLRYSLFAAALVVPVLLVYGALVSLHVVGLLLACITSFGVWYLLFVTTRPLAVAFPDYCRTIGDVVRCAGPPHYPSQRATPIPHDSRAVWDKLVQMLMQEFGLKKSDVTPDARFIDDLGLD